MALSVGLGGAARNGCAALCTLDAILGVCEQERVTRVRGSGFNATGLPDEAIDELLRRAGRGASEISCYSVAESVHTLTSNASTPGEQAPEQCGRAQR